ncbi:general secretion pathway protein GspB [Aestuariibacter salexigens]|uniref:general secretion pathway protein GspB n=1 Tax=Aestuariibacter salexigens TaxID=226010 RepID=UPI0003FACACC|nr:general secretion pathway protein GspB [Aestuariibacter salexigens]
MPERISIDNLQAGMVIIGITEQNGPVKIRKSGLVTSQDMVRGLAEMGVLEVEIDPAQTVEIDAAASPVSHTRQLLTGNKRVEHGSGNAIDHSLSDQFNRSLFLPSVQGLPSVWQHYGKKSLSAVIVVFGGFAVGWVAANWSSYLAMLSAPANVVNQSQQLPASNESKSIDASTEPPTTVIANTAPQTETSEVVSEPTEREFVDNSDEEEGTILNAQPEAEPAISQELLRRFNQAVAELDEEPRESAPVTVRNNDDIPRVDQLPVRLLTRLPSMSFNAHMYASNPSDRWVRVNGIRLVEGDWLNDNLQLVEIEPQHVVLSFEGEAFRMAALSDW